MDTARVKIENMWELQYKPVSSSFASNQETVVVKNHFLKWRADKKGGTQLAQDEYQQYIRCACIDIPDTDLRCWWLEPTQRKLYPHLRIMALDILSIPAMAAEPERLFSSARIAITDRRGRLGIEPIEAIECLKSWLRKDNISWVDQVAGL